MTFSLIQGWQTLSNCYSFQAEILAWFERFGTPWPGHTLMHFKRTLITHLFRSNFTRVPFGVQTRVLRTFISVQFCFGCPVFALLNFALNLFSSRHQPKPKSRLVAVGTKTAAAISGQLKTFERPFCMGNETQNCPKGIIVTLAIAPANTRKFSSCYA